MKDETKEIYLSNLEWTKTHDNMGGVMGNAIFKNSISLKEFEKIVENTYVILCDKDYITNLQEENERLSRTITDYDELLMQRNNIIDKYKNVIDKIKKYCELNKEFTPRLEDILELLEEVE